MIDVNPECPPPKRRRGPRGAYKRHPRRNPTTVCPRCGAGLRVYDTRGDDDTITRRLRCVSDDCGYKTCEVDER